MKITMLKSGKSSLKIIKKNNNKQWLIFSKIELIKHLKICKFDIK